MNKQRHILVALLLVAGLAVLVGAYMFSMESSSDSMVATSTPQQTASTTTDTTIQKNIPSVAGDGIPSCVISAQPGPSSWVLDQKNRVVLTWTSEEGIEAYLWLVEPMGGSIVEAAIQKGGKVALNGSQTVEIQPASSYPDERYVLVVKGSRGTFVCDTDGERFLWGG